MDIEPLMAVFGVLLFIDLGHRIWVDYRNKRWEEKKLHEAMKKHFD